MSALAYEALERFSDHMHAAAVRYRARWPHLLVNERLFQQCVEWAQSLPKNCLPARRRALEDYAQNEEEKAAAKNAAPLGSGWRLRNIPAQDHGYVLNGAYLLHMQNKKYGELDDDDVNQSCQLYWNDRSSDLSLTSRDQLRESRRQKRTLQLALSDARKSGDPARIQAAERALRLNWVTVRRAPLEGLGDDGASAESLEVIGSIGWLKRTGEIEADMGTEMLAQIGWPEPPTSMAPLYLQSAAAAERRCAP